MTLSNVIHTMIRRASAEHMAEQETVLARGLAIRLYVDDEQALHLALWRRESFPSLAEWKAVTLSIPDYFDRSIEPAQTWAKNKRALTGRLPYCRPDPFKQGDKKSMDTQTHPKELVRAWLARDPIFLDTETTGLGPFDQICEIAILAADGSRLIDTLVKPTIQIPEEATRIHGITNADVREAPAWDLVSHRIDQIIDRRTVVIYNAAYDLALIRQSTYAGRMDICKFLESSEFVCAMLAYAEYRGEWNDFRGSYRWHRLEVACSQMGINTADLTAHRAAADCELTRRLVLKMAEA